MEEKIRDIKEKYKHFLAQEISMTAEERKHVRTAYETVKLAEMSLKVDSEMKNFKPQDFDFNKLKETCSHLLECFIGEIPIIYLLPIFYQMMYNSFYEVSLFLASVMNEILQKVEKIRGKSISQHCVCVQNMIIQIKYKVNFVSWNLLDRIFAISSILHTIGPIKDYQR